MKKKLVMLSPESVFSGFVKCGMAELVDSLANSLGQDYRVTIVCIDGNGIMSRATSGFHEVEDGIHACRFSCVDYYLIKQSMWPDKAIKVIDALKPDIFHNLAQPEYIRLLKERPAKAIYTFDSKDILFGKEDTLLEYDSIATNSKAFANAMLRSRDSLSMVLSYSDFHGVTTGILDTVLSPEKGLLLPAKYNSKNQDGKKLCKERLKQTYGISGDPYICLMMCRLVPEKGIDQVLDVIKTIKDTGGILIVVGKGIETYEQQLRSYNRTRDIIYVDKWASPVYAAPLAAGSDFFLQPSLMESGGIMPLTASRYGAIPIVTLAGGLADSLNDENAIIVEDDGLDRAIRRAADLYHDKEALVAKRTICMEQDFSWTTRKQGYISMYESN